MNALAEPITRLNHEELRLHLVELKREDKSNWYCAGDFEIEASFDRVAIIEDEFRSGYECDNCHETGRLTCPECEGSGKHRVIADAKCSECQGDGKLRCAACKGLGKLLEIPEYAKRRPTTGQIVSRGLEVQRTNYFQAGDFVMFPNYCGEVYDLHGINSAGKELTIVVRVIKQHEIISKVRGHLKLGRVRHQSQVTG